MNGMMIERHYKNETGSLLDGSLCSGGLSLTPNVSRAERINRGKRRQLSTETNFVRALFSIFSSKKNPFL